MSWVWGSCMSYTIDDFIGVLVGLMGTDGKFRGLGIIEHIDFMGRSIEIYTTVKNFSILQFGSIKLDTRDFSYTGIVPPENFQSLSINRPRNIIRLI